MPKSITDLATGDVIVIRKQGSNESQRVTVRVVGRGKFDYDNQPYFVDTNDSVYWRGHVIIEDVVEEVPRDRAQKERRGWADEFVNEDGTRKDFKEAIFVGKDGRTFADEVRGIVDSTKATVGDFLTLMKDAALWAPRQFPKIDTFDLENDERTEYLFGYRPAGINEVQRTRYVRTGTTLKMVDNGSGSMPRRFGSFYVTNVGLGLVVIVALVSLTVFGSLISRLIG